jgi:hypothetical protein
LARNRTLTGKKCTEQEQALINAAHGDTRGAEPTDGSRVAAGGRGAALSNNRLTKEVHNQLLRRRSIEEKGKFLWKIKVTA